jgi:hypothetical protein
MRIPESSVAGLKTVETLFVYIIGQPASDTETGLNGCNPSRTIFNI